MSAKTFITSSQKHFSYEVHIKKGRSILEMLGVLAIIGVLSLVGLTLYSLSMTYYRANETIHDVMLRATNVPMIWEDFQENRDGREYVFNELTTFNPIDYPVHVFAETEPSIFAFRVVVSNVPDTVCKRIIEMDPTDISFISVDYISANPPGESATKENCKDLLNNMAFYFDTALLEEPDDPTCKLTPADCNEDSEEFDPIDCKCVFISNCQNGCGSCQYCDENSGMCLFYTATDKNCTSPTPDFNVATCECVCNKGCDLGYTLNKEKCECECSLNEEKCTAEGKTFDAQTCSCEGCKTDTDCIGSGEDYNPCMKCVDNGNNSKTCQMDGTLLNNGSGLECCFNGNKESGYNAAYYSRMASGSGCEDGCFDDDIPTVTIKGKEYFVANSCCPSTQEEEIGTCGPMCKSGSMGIPEIRADGKTYCCPGGRNNLNDYHVCPVKGANFFNQAQTKCCPSEQRPYFDYHTKSAACCDKDVKNVNGYPELYECCEENQKAYWNGQDTNCCSGSLYAVAIQAGLDVFNCCDTTNGKYAVAEAIGTDPSGIHNMEACCSTEEFGTKPTAYWNGTEIKCCKGNIYQSGTDEAGNPIYNCCVGGVAVTNYTQSGKEAGVACCQKQNSYTNSTNYGDATETEIYDNYILLDKAVDGICCGGFTFFATEMEINGHPESKTREREYNNIFTWKKFNGKQYCTEYSVGYGLPFEFRTIYIASLSSDCTKYKAKDIEEPWGYNDCSLAYDLYGHDLDNPEILFSIFE